MKSTNDIKSMKGTQKITMLTAYNHFLATIIDNVEIDLILVGDSGVMVELGKESTKDATMEEMILLTKAVTRTATKTHIIGDMPIDTYNNPEDAVKNAKLMKEAGVHSVKVEGPCTEVIQAIRKEGIEVMGHIGLTPQLLDNYKVQGREDTDAERLKKESKQIEEAGAYAIVLECIPQELAKEISELISIPTIGIGAGVDCDGQVLVTNDMLGMYEKLSPKFVRKYMDFGKLATEAIQKYKIDVQEKKFPAEEESFN